jgi:hypothetical protein
MSRIEGELCLGTMNMGYLQPSSQLTSDITVGLHKRNMNCAKILQMVSVMNEVLILVANSGVKFVMYLDVHH